MEFPGFLGNSEVKQALSVAFAAGRFPHAVMLHGERGSGKSTLAEIVAQALVCRDKSAAPCGRCPSCIRARAGSHPDVQVVRGGGASGALTVEAVRLMLEDAYRMPEEADYNVYIVYLGEHSLPAAQNKLLKLIEEPPQGAVFLLLCPSAEAALPTIRSRVQIFTLRPPEREEAAQWLVAHYGMEPEQARELADLCGGNLGRMQEELKGGGLGQAFSIAKEMAEAMLGTGGHPLLKAAAPLQKDRSLFREALARLAVIFRDACVARAGGTTALSGAVQTVDKLCNLPMRRLLCLPDLVEEYRQKLERNATTGLLLTCFCAELLENGR